MTNHDGRGTVVRLPQEDLATRPGRVPAERTDELLDDLAGRLSQRLEVVVREQVGQELADRLDPIEAKVGRLSKQLQEAALHPPVVVTPAPSAAQALQRQALDRVD